jgi:hypothetical protein
LSCRTQKWTRLKNRPLSCQAHGRERRIVPVAVDRPEKVGGAFSGGRRGAVPGTATRGLWLVSFVFAVFSAIYGSGVTDKGNNLAPKSVYGRTELAARSSANTARLGSRPKHCRRVRRTGRARRRSMAAPGLAGAWPISLMGVAVGHDNREHPARRRTERARRGSAHARAEQRRHRSDRSGKARQPERHAH